MKQTIVEDRQRPPGNIEVIEAYWSPDWVPGALELALDAVINDPLAERCYSFPIERFDVDDDEEILDQLALGQKRTWPEVEIAIQLGKTIAVLVRVPFLFTSPLYPEIHCPRYWERADGVPCVVCGLVLKQPNWCDHPGICWLCHVRRNRHRVAEEQPLWDQQLDG
jgi:hypothetical protein